MNIRKVILFFLILLPGILWSEKWRFFTLYKNYYTCFRESGFNPANRTMKALGYTNGPHGSLFQHLSLQTELLSLQWQLDILGRLKYENNKWDNIVDIKQFYFQKDLSPTLILMTGRAILRWGTGYAFNPTDVVAPGKRLNDPENREKLTSGNDLVKLEYFGKSFSLAFCYVTTIDMESSFSSWESTLAFRFYQNMYGMDVSLIGCLDKEESPVWGANFSAVTGDRLEVHGELSAQQGSYTCYHQTIGHGSRLFTENPLSDFRRNDNKYYCRYLAGFQYTLPGNILWIAEYYHQDQGYSAKEWESIMDQQKFIYSRLKPPFEELAEANLLWSLNVFSAKGAMRDYLMNYIQIPLNRKIELRSTCLLNLADFSYVFIPELNIQIGNYFTFYERNYIFQGKRKTEFGEFFQSFYFEIGIYVK
ncbi:MAG: hypothetical protein R6V04_16645 [bacterium]